MDDKTEKIDLDAQGTQVMGPVDGAEGNDVEEIANSTTEPKKGLSKNAKIGIAVGACAVVAAAAIGVFMWAQTPATLPADEQVEPALVDEQEEGTPQKVKVGLEGYEAQEGDTPLIAHVQGTTDGNRSVDYYHAVSGASEEMELVPGGYSVDYVPVIKSDGSLVKAKQAASAVVANDAASATSETETKAAEDVTQDDVNGVLEAVKKAVENGDDTLKGDKGKDVVDKVAAAAKATGKVDEAKVDEAKQEAETKAEEPSGGTDAGQPAASNGSSSSNGGGSNGGSSSGSAPSAPASQPASQPASDNVEAGKQEQPSTLAHVHDWQPVYSTVVDREAYTSHEPAGEYIQCSCGATFNSDTEWGAHVKAAGRGSQHSYSVMTKYADVYHPAVTHQEITGYTCSCGATK